MSVWEAMLDNRYLCKVEREVTVRDVGTGDEGYVGVLTVFDTVEEKELLHQAVTLSYAATFGPDVADVEDWQNRCLEVIDARAAPVAGQFICTVEHPWRADMEFSPGTMVLHPDAGPVEDDKVERRCPACGYEWLRDGP